MPKDYVKSEASSDTPKARILVASVRDALGPSSPFYGILGKALDLMTSKVRAEKKAQAAMAAQTLPAAANDLFDAPQRPIEELVIEAVKDPKADIFEIAARFGITPQTVDQMMIDHYLKPKKPRKEKTT